PEFAELPHGPQHVPSQLLHRSDLLCSGDRRTPSGARLSTIMERGMGVIFTAAWSLRTRAWAAWIWGSLGRSSRGPLLEVCSGEWCWTCAGQAVTVKDEGGAGGSERGTAMTEAEWDACGSASPMLKFLGQEASDRKQRLFAVACCRRVWHLLKEEPARQMV